MTHHNNKSTSESKRNAGELFPGQGIPRHILFMMAAVSGLTVANCYYNQPLLEDIRQQLNVTEVQANLITFITQLGYALGLLFVIPLADKLSRRSIVITNLSLAAVMCCVIAVSDTIATVWAASLVLGLCSVVPQIFVPMAGVFSLPENKSRNMGIVLSGLLSGVLGARVISGYVGEYTGWRTMFYCAGAIMVVCLCWTLRTMPMMRPTFSGSYTRLMRSVFAIYASHPAIRIYSLRAALAFGSMMSIWSCMAFHLAQEPFRAGSEQVGMLGLCGMAGAIAASGVGKYIPRLGIHRVCIIGTLLQFMAWTTALCFGHCYMGLVAAIILVDIGAQCHQLSNQSGCLQLAPEAANRANTIFMTHLFIGGSIGTLCTGLAWNHAGWTGVCLTGLLFAAASLTVTLWKRTL